VTLLHWVNCRFTCERAVQIHDNTVAIHLYHIAREAIYKAIRHSFAKNFAVTLPREGEEMNPGIADDGSGLPPDAG
jgi:signal transduction histidine kinase